ncbi:MAG: hypothetical protein KDD45_13375 [Bdellovibrionales bacterium]|nr:hypothetical protein [Bdellovibrionales bacterium]
MTLQFNNDETIVYIWKADNTLYEKGKCRSLEKATLYLISSFIEGLQDFDEVCNHMNSVLESKLRCKRQVYGTKHDYVAMMLYRIHSMLIENTFIRQESFSVEHYCGESSYSIILEIKAVYYKQEFFSEREAHNFVKKLYDHKRINKHTFLSLSMCIDKGFKHEIGPYIISHSTKADAIIITGKDVSKKIAYIEDSLSLIFKFFMFSLLQKEELRLLLSLLQRMNLSSRNSTPDIVLNRVHPDRGFNRIISFDNHIDSVVMSIKIFCDQSVFQYMNIEVKPFFFSYSTPTVIESYNLLKILEQGNRISKNRAFALRDRLTTCLNNS